jgi:hypothetical protein
MEGETLALDPTRADHYFNRFLARADRSNSVRDRARTLLTEARAADQRIGMPKHVEVADGLLKGPRDRPDPRPLLPAGGAGAPARTSASWPGGSPPRGRS